MAFRPTNKGHLYKTMIYCTNILNDDNIVTSFECSTPTTTQKFYEGFSQGEVSIIFILGVIAVTIFVQFLVKVYTQLHDN